MVVTSSTRIATGLVPAPWQSPSHPTPPMSRARPTPSSPRGSAELGDVPWAAVPLVPVTDDDVLIPAATVLLLRDHDDGPEVLMLRRNSKIAFGGMWVFPGGRVDDDELDHDDHLGSARRAAAREVAEETGLEIDGGELFTWSYWVPPPRAAMKGNRVKRFSTWFFVGRCPDGEVSVDGGEIHEHRWFRPGDAIDRHRGSEIEIVPPTWLTLWQLDTHRSVDAALGWASSAEPEEFFTRPIAADPVILAWGGDAGYDQQDPGVAGPRNRLTLDPGGWVYERT